MIAVDTNVLLDVLAGDATHGPASLRALERALELGSVIACDVVFAETSAFFPDSDSAIEVLDAMGIVFSPTTEAAALNAGERWRTSTQTRGRVIADVLVGSHAVSLGVPLLTRDRGFYRSMFSDLEVIAP